MTLRLSLLLVLTLGACAHREEAPRDTMPFDQRLARFEGFHNKLQIEELETYFTPDATIQSPVTPRGSRVQTYLRALSSEPFTFRFSNTEVIYAFSDRVATVSDATVTSPGRFNLKSRVSMDWKMEDGYWRIARLRFAEWPAVAGIWRRGGLRREGSIELRIIPDGTYLVYLADDFSFPEFKGRYRIEGNRIALTDTGANDRQRLEEVEGVYLFTRTESGIDLRKLQDENSWRSERFDGAWSAAR